MTAPRPEAPTPPGRLRRIRPLRPGDHGPVHEADGACFAVLPGAPAEGFETRGWLAAGRRALRPWRLVGGALLPLVPALAALSWNAPATALLLAGALLLALHAAECTTPGQRDASLAMHGPFWDRLLRLRPEAFARVPLPILGHRLATGLLGAMNQALGAQAQWHAALVLAGAFGILLAAAPVLALLAAGLLAAAAALLARLAAAAAAAGQAGAWRRGPTAVRIEELAQALPELRPLGAAGWATGRALRAGRRGDRAARQAEAASARLALAGGALPGVLALALSAAVLAGATPGLVLGDLAAALLACLPAGQAVVALAGLRGQAAMQAGRLRALERSIGAAAPADGLAGLPPPRLETLEVRGLGFAWPGAREPLLQDLSFTLRRGEVLALSGPSGGGKTTLLRLLLGLIRPQAGEILLNGRPIETYAPGPLRRRFGAVMQDPGPMITTVRHAICGEFPHDAAMLAELMALVGLEEAVAELPMGVETLVVEGVFPTALLGRLRIARALACAPELLVLDEALVSLDAAEAAALVGRLRARGLTMILCAHDPTQRALADRVIRLGDPREA